MDQDNISLRLLNVEVGNTTGPLATAVVHDARLYIMDLEAREIGAQNRAAELEREGGVPESLRRCATALERLARRHGYRGDD
jgi:hypothetical protein